jgi:elongation factor P
MVTASQVRPGMCIRYEGQTYRVITAEYYSGQGKMTGGTHARLKNLATQSTWETTLRGDMKLDTLDLERVPAEFLYAEATHCCFMNSDTFEQYEVPNETLGPAARFLQTSMKISLELVEGQVVNAIFPDSMESRVVETAPPVHAQQDSTWKPARLENGVEILVPQFIKVDDVVRVDLAAVKYMERAKGSGR